MFRRSWALAAALVLMASCQGRKSARHRDAGPITVGPRTQSLPGPTVIGPPPDLPLPRELRFELLDAGAAPRTARRYRFDGAARELTALARTTTRSNIDGAWTEAVVQAPVTDGFGITAEAVPAGGGLVHLRGLVASIDETGASEAGRTAAAAYLTRWRALLERRRVDVRVDARGRLDEVTVIDDPGGVRGAETEDDVAQRWLSLAVPLPDEAIGVGARWRAVTALRAGGAVLKQTGTYHLTAVDGERWTVAIEVERLGEHQDVRVPGMPPGAAAELVALRRLVTGTVVVGAASPLPVSGTLTAEVASHARFTVRDHQRSERYVEDHATITLASTP